MTPDADAAAHSERARLGGLARAARYDGREMTAKATATRRAKFLREVDPDGTLPEAERERRAAAAERFYMARLAYRSHAAQRRNRAAEVTPEAD